MSWHPSKKCTVCGAGHGRCSETDEGAVVCRRVSGGSVKEVTGGGWLHLPHGAQLRSTGYEGRVVTITTLVKGTDLAPMATAYTQALWPALVERLADNLGVTADSLRRLGIGWAHNFVSRRGGSAEVFDAGQAILQGDRHWSFPMVNAAGEVVGIRIRTDAGVKFSITGGKEGLFIPSDLSPTGPLLICEGPTDTAALLDLGFNAIGRPSAMGGFDLLVDYAKRHKPPEVVIVSDADFAGKTGAEKLATVLRAHIRMVRVITPLAGIKDARAWRKAGATTADVQSVIDATAHRKLRIVAPPDDSPVKVHAIETEAAIVRY